MKQEPLTIRVRNVYGRVRYFPDSELAKTFASLIGKKTFTPNHLKLIKALGYEITLKHEDLPI